MERKHIAEKAKQFLSKYKFVGIVLAVGILLMLLPSASSQPSPQSPQPQSTQDVQTLAQELEAMLSQVRGAGKVRVMLNIIRGEQTVYQTDKDTSISETNQSDRTQTVTLTDSGRNQTGLIQQVNPPQYLGALIVCQGADDASVRLAIVEAVSKITGLGANQISVLKMK